MESHHVQATDPDECPTPGPRSVIPSLSSIEKGMEEHKVLGPTHYVVLGFAVSLLLLAIVASTMIWG